jgi:hypothetical protein
MSKKETLEEYLKRGGVITKLPSGPSPEEEHRVASAPNASTTMMSLGEGALFYAEGNAKRKEKKKKIEPPINFSALPSSLRKYMPQDNEN